MKKIQSIRGMHDVLPNEAHVWQFLENKLAEVLERYAYRELKTPIVEQTELFKRSIGDVTDIVEKEMYTFEDRNGDSLSLRPEGTASCVRAGIQHGLFYNQQQKIWYRGPMFRHERPQKGRYRQFVQLGAEAYGIPGADIEAELIILGQRFWQELGVENSVSLQINTLGSAVCRQGYKEILVDYFSDHIQLLDEDSSRRLQTNPLRILDSKNPEMAAIIAAAPSLHEHLDQESRTHFGTLCHLLDATGINYTISPTLVRGLDYYSHTVFEWVTELLGAQGTVCAGGRYDGLVEQLGGRATPAVGFAMGMDRIKLLVETVNPDIIKKPELAAYIIMPGDDLVVDGLMLAEKLRTDIPGISIQTNMNSGSIKSQMKRADKSGADFALIMADDELKQGKTGLKNLRDNSEEQLSVDYQELLEKLSRTG